MTYHMVIFQLMTDDSIKQTIYPSISQMSDDSIFHVLLQIDIAQSDSEK